MANFNMSRGGFDPNILARAMAMGIAEAEQDKRRADEMAERNELRQLRDASFLAQTGMTPQNLLMGSEIAGRLPASQKEIAAEMAVRQREDEGGELSPEIPLVRDDWQQAEEPQTPQEDMRRTIAGVTDLPEVSQEAAATKARGRLSPEEQYALSGYEKLMGEREKKAERQEEGFELKKEHMAIQKQKMAQADARLQSQIEKDLRNIESVKQRFANDEVKIKRSLNLSIDSLMKERTKLSTLGLEPEDEEIQRQNYDARIAGYQAEIGRLRKKDTSDNPLGI